MLAVIAALSSLQALASAGVDPWVESELQRSDEVEFIVRFRARAELGDVRGERDVLRRRTAVVGRLQHTARSSQAAVLHLLLQRGFEHRPFWIANAIWVRGDRALLNELLARPEIAHIHGNPRISAHLPEIQPGTARGPSGIEWNITLIGAPEVWNKGVNGEGTVVGGQDTGYQWDHPALINQYRGWDGKSADHNYNWHDAIHTDNVSCDGDSQFPCDDDGHGTHTMGIMVGDDGSDNQTGVAPGAKWIGCRGMDDGFGTSASYMECFEWFVAPTDLNDENADPSKAPHVINNSWSCPPTPIEDCDNPEILLDTVSNVLAAGILVVAAAGNEGLLGCSTVQFPPAIYEPAFTVGATTMSDAIWSNSSRGPVTVDSSNRLKPDVTAPGSNVRSSWASGTYAVASGTSMAAPHVAGLAALMISANPALAGDPDTIRSRIENHAKPLTSKETCGAVPGSSIPNNTFGHGRIDAFASVFDLIFWNGFEIIPDD